MDFAKGKFANRVYAQEATPNCVSIKINPLTQYMPRACYALALTRVFEFASCVLIKKIHWQKAAQWGQVDHFYS